MKIHSYAVRLSLLAGVTAAACGGAFAQSTSASDLLAMVNQARTSGVTCARTGAYYPPVKPLQLSRNLTRAATDWSRRMASAGSLSHGDPRARIRAACPNPGYVGENIAYNPSGPNAVQRWIKSRKGHCETLMDPKFAVAGIGYSGGGLFGRGGYWTIDFAGRCR